MIVNRDIKKYREINILLDILSGDFMSYVAKIVTLCPKLYVRGHFDWIPFKTQMIRSRNVIFIPNQSSAYLIFMQNAPILGAFRFKRNIYFVPEYIQL